MNQPSIWIVQIELHNLACPSWTSRTPKVGVCASPQARLPLHLAQPVTDDPSSRRAGDLLRTPGPFYLSDDTVQDLLGLPLRHGFRAPPRTLHMNSAVLGDG